MLSALSCVSSNCNYTLALIINHLSQMAQHTLPFININLHQLILHTCLPPIVFHHVYIEIPCTPIPASLFRPLNQPFLFIIQDGPTRLGTTLRKLLILYTTSSLYIFRRNLWHWWILWLIIYTRMVRTMPLKLLILSAGSKRVASIKPIRNFEEK